MTSYATLESRSGAEAEEEQEAEVEAEEGGKAEGVPLTITPPPGEHRLDAEESGIGWKGIEPKVRVRIWCGASRFLVWNSITFSGACLRFSEYSQVFSSVP